MAEPSSRWYRFWIFVAFASLAMIVISEVATVQVRAREAAYQAAVVDAIAAFRLGEEAWRAEKAVAPLVVQRDWPWGQAEPHPLNREQLAARIFHDAAPVYAPNSPRGFEEVHWRAASRGLDFHIKFRSDGAWSSISFAPIMPSRPSTPLLARLREQVDPLRRAWAARIDRPSVGPVLWLGLLVATCWPTRYRRPLSHALVLVAWLCFLGWLLAPHYPISFSGITSNDMLFWGTVMMIVSIGVFVAVRRMERPPDPTRCAGCDYDLTGNVSGVCPECGAAVSTVGAAPAAPAAP